MSVPILFLLPSLFGSLAPSTAGFSAQQSLGCLVTGGTGGIGAELVKQLAARGHRVAFTARNPVAGRALEREVRSCFGERSASYWPLDLRFARAAHFALLAEAIERELGAPVSLLVNNAALCERGTDARTFSRALRVNVAAPSSMCATLLPQMRARRFGRIVNVSSGDGELVFLHSSVRALLAECETLDDLKHAGSGVVRRFDAQIEYAYGPTPAYSWSKAMLNRATQLMAGAIGDDENVLLNAVCPGDVMTRMMSGDVRREEARTPSEGAASLLSAMFLDAATRRGVPNGQFLRDGEAIAF